MGIITLLFLIWRLVDLAVAWISGTFGITHSAFQFGFDLYHQDTFIPKFLVSFANFDGAHYLRIARYGYDLYQQAFFPLFPLLIRTIGTLFFDRLFIAGLVIANVSFFFGLLLFKKYLERIGKSPSVTLWTLLFLLTFPTSFFFGSVYTEGFFFLLVTGMLYYMQLRKYWVAGAMGFFASLTKLMGLFLIIPLSVTVFIHPKKRPFLVLLSPFLGFVTYMLYLWLTTHDPLYFYHALGGFHTGRTVGQLILLPQVYYRYIAIFLKASPNTVEYGIAAVEFLLFNLVFGVLLYDLWVLWKNSNIQSRLSLIGLNLFSLVNLLLPTFTGTFTSIPRYALFSLSFFLRIGQIQSTVLKVILLAVFTALHIILLNLFIRGYFVS